MNGRSFTKADRYQIPGVLPGKVANIIERHANDNGTTVDAILRGCRTQRVGFARRIICERLRAQGHSLPQIGRWLRLHHTSVLYQLRKGEARNG